MGEDTAVETRLSPNASSERHGETTWGIPTGDFREPILTLSRKREEKKKRRRRKERIETRERGGCEEKSRAGTKNSPKKIAEAREGKRSL